MLSKDTLESIEIIKRMDLKVAVPPKFAPYPNNGGSLSTTIETACIHVPSVIAMLLFEIEQKQREIEDVKKATRILLDIKNNPPKEG